MAITHDSDGAGVDRDGLTDLVVNPWKRYGHDRLYVHDGGGRRVGYLDNMTGVTVVEEEGRRTSFDAAVAAYRTSNPATPPVVAKTPTPLPYPLAVSTVPGAGSATTAQIVPIPTPSPSTPSPSGLERPWTDLATNRPGEGARSQAVTERKAAPVKAVIARALGVHTDERAWRIGADGEEAVAARLSRLGNGWKVLHAVPVGRRGSDIDHVVIGPGGAYTVNAKHHPETAVVVDGDSFKVNGRSVPYVRNSRFEASRASKLLSGAVGFPVFVTGVIAIVGAHEGVTIKCQPADGQVFVVRRKDIHVWLSRRGEILSPEQIELIYTRARRSTTWSHD